jgi:hypothetical protein
MRHLPVTDHKSIHSGPWKLSDLIKDMVTYFLIYSVAIPGQMLHLLYSQLLTLEDS